VARQRRCDACHNEEPDVDKYHRVYAGMDMTLCVDPTACRQRAQSRGEWCRG
jgi:hypothetical protein